MVTYEKKGKTYELFNDWQFMYPNGGRGREGGREGSRSGGCSGRGGVDDCGVMVTMMIVGGGGGGGDGVVMVVVVVWWG